MSSNLKAFLNVTLNFLPLIFLWSIPNKFGLVFGLASIISLFVRGVINKNIGSMSVVLLIYFAISSILYLYFNMEIVIQYKYLISYMVLALTGGISIILGKPYTMYEAGYGYNKEFTKSPLFIEVNIVITKIWTVIYLINAIIELAGHSIVNIVIMNVLVIMGITLSIIIPGALPEV